MGRPNCAPATDDVSFRVARGWIASMSAGTDDSTSRARRADAALGAMCSHDRRAGADGGGTSDLPQTRPTGTHDVARTTPLDMRVTANTARARGLQPRGGCGARPAGGVVAQYSTAGCRRVAFDFKSNCAIGVFPASAQRMAAAAGVEQPREERMRQQIGRMCLTTKCARNAPLEVPHAPRKERPWSSPHRRETSTCGCIRRACPHAMLAHRMYRTRPHPHATTRKRETTIPPRADMAREICASRQHTTLPAATRRGEGVGG